MAETLIARMASPSVLDRLKVEIHPNKTFIGTICRSFDFLGYRFDPGSLTVSRSTVQRFTERIAQLYEKGADVSPASGGTSGAGSDRFTAESII